MHIEVKSEFPDKKGGVLRPLQTRIIVIIFVILKHNTIKWTISILAEDETVRLYYYFISFNGTVNDIIILITM